VGQNFLQLSLVKTAHSTIGDMAQDFTTTDCQPTTQKHFSTRWTLKTKIKQNKCSLVS